MGVQLSGTPSFPPYYFRVPLFSFNVPLSTPRYIQSLSLPINRATGKSLTVAEIYVRALQQAVLLFLLYRICIIYRLLCLRLSDVAFSMTPSVSSGNSHLHMTADPALEIFNAL